MNTTLKQLTTYITLSTLIIGGIVLAGPLFPSSNTDTQNFVTLEDIYQRTQNFNYVLGSHDLVFSSQTTSTMHTLEDVWNSMRSINLPDISDVRDGVIYGLSNRVTGTMQPNCTHGSYINETIYTSSTTLNKFQPINAPAPTMFTLEDIYQKTLSYNYDSNGLHNVSASASPLSSMHTLLDIWNSMSSVIFPDPSDVRGGVYYGQASSPMIGTLLTGCPSDAANIISFILPGQYEGTIIDQNNNTISVIVPTSVDLSSLVPNINISQGATILPAISTSQNFTQPFIYTVTAENGSTTKQYTVNATTSEDTLAPTLTNLDYSPQTIDTSSGAAIVNFDVSFQDNLSGVFRAVACARSVNYPELAAICSDGTDLLSGTQINGTIRFGMTFPQYSAQGNWNIYEINIVDNAGNWLNPAPIDYSSLMINQISVGDIQAPVITGVSFDKTSINTSTSSQTVTATVSFTDDLTGVDHVILWVNSPSTGSNLYSQNQLYSGTSINGTMQISIPFPQNSEVGVWTFTPGAAYDLTGKERQFNPTDTVTVDNTPPVTVPDAPTNVSAIVGNAQATVSFTAPVNNGGSAITSYTVTSSSTGVAVTATGSASPIIVTGLTNGTAYTFTVTATNAIGTSTPSSASNSVTPAIPLSIGQSYQGGKIGYILAPGDLGYDAGMQHGLIAALESWQAGGDTPWITGGSTQTTLNGNVSTAIGTGQANTTFMMAQSGYTGGAAQVCVDYISGGYSDWYLPSHEELKKLYLNRTAIAPYSTGWGYWSSSERDASSAWQVNFGTGSDGSNSKNYVNILIRCTRSF